MAVCSFNGVSITGISATVPKNIYNNKTDNSFFSQETVFDIIEKIGVYQRRVADENMCASDLCFCAAHNLIEEMNIERNEIDFLIFVSQTPDYRMPATSFILQDRLGLPKTCAAFDINLGCSGFVVGLNIAYSLAAQSSIRKILLLNGETRTKVYSFKDRKTGFLFGDAGAASLIEKSHSVGDSFFVIESDGSKNDYIKIKCGGYRYPSSSESFKEIMRNDGSIRSDEQGYMDGSGVFEFVITEVPRQIKNLYQISGYTKDDIDYFILHQANKFMNEHLLKKMKIEPAKAPMNLNKYGNTSSVSIPLTIVSELQEKIQGKKQKILLSGFGVGLSLASAILDIDKIHICKLTEL